MSTQYTLKICTPRGTFLEEQVQEVTIPSADGEVGILPRHTSYTADTSPRRIVVANGFIQFEGDTLLVLADSVDTSDSVDIDGYSSERASLQKLIETERIDSAEWARARSALDRIMAIDELVSN
jgi:F0F1-type ATP synthase epsilon subunit